MSRALLYCELAGKLAALAWWTLHPWSRVGALLFLAPDLVILYHVFVPSAQGLCRVFTYFDTPRQEIWLTIDDGPDPHDTPRILDLLDRYQARATFFLVGTRAARWPELMREIHRRGHEIGHHTHTHPRVTFWCASAARVARELDRTLAVMAQVSVIPQWFRAPVGIKNLFLAPALQSRNLRCVGWSVRSFDAGSSDPKAVVARVMCRVKPGAIVLMHEGPTVNDRVRVHALEFLLAALHEKRIACVVPKSEQLR